MQRAQVMVEYGLLIAIIGAAMVTMQVYAKRGIQAQLKIYTDMVLPSQEKNEEFGLWDPKTGKAGISGERRMSGRANSSLPFTQKVKWERGGAQTTTFNEIEIVVPFDRNRNPAENSTLPGISSFFAADKRSGSLSSQGQAETEYGDEFAE